MNCKDTEETQKLGAYFNNRLEVCPDCKKPFKETKMGTGERKSRKPVEDVHIESDFLEEIGYKKVEPRPIERPKLSDVLQLNDSPAKGLKELGTFIDAVGIEYANNLIEWANEQYKAMEAFFKDRS